MNRWSYCSSDEDDEEDDKKEKGEPEKERNGDKDNIKAIENVKIEVQKSDALYLDGRSRKVAVSAGRVKFGKPNLWFTELQFRGFLVQ